LPIEEAKAHIDAGRYKEAYEPLRQSILMVENPPIAWRRVLASLCLELNNTKEAIDVFRGIASEEEATESDFMGLFYAYSLLDDEKNALGVLSAAQAAGKLDKEAGITTYSSMLAQSGGAIRAAKLLRRAIDENKIAKTAQNHERLFYAYRQAREHKEGLRAIRLAIAAKPSERLYSQAAYAAFESGEFERAIAAANKAIELNATHADSLRLLIGASAIETKDYMLARSAFAEALKSAKYAKRARNWLDYLDELTIKQSEK
jgi:tetratricopeptide (TPR) repeat protein